MLGVFSLPAFTRVGHESQDLFSPCDGMHVCRLDLGIYSHPKEFWGNRVRNFVNSKGEKTSTGGSEEVRTRDARAASHRAASPTHYRLNYSLLVSLSHVCFNKCT